MIDIRLRVLTRYCPVQLRGTVCGVPVYYRARSGKWALYEHPRPPVSDEQLLTDIRALREQGLGETEVYHRLLGTLVAEGGWDGDPHYAGTVGDGVRTIVDHFVDRVEVGV